MAVGALVISLIGTAVSAYGSYQSGKAQQRAAEYNAKVEENQAIQADMENRENIRRERRAGKNLMSEQRQKLGASGVVIQTGSPLELLGKTAGELELRAQDAARAGRSQLALGFSRAQQSRIQGKAAYQSGVIGAAGTLLQGAGQAASYRK